MEENILKGLETITLGGGCFWCLEAVFDKLMETFYPAEDYHQNYFEKNPYQGYCQVVIAPKVSKFRQKYSEKLKG